MGKRAILLRFNLSALSRKIGSMRLLYICCLWMLAAFSYAQSEPSNGSFWQHVEPTLEGSSYSQYLNSIDAPQAYISDTSVLHLGNRTFTLGDNRSASSLVRYQSVSYALVSHFYKEQPTRYFLASSRGSYNEIKAVAIGCSDSFNQTIRTISIDGEVLCAKSQELIVGNDTYSLPVKALHKVIGTSYTGYWQLTFIGEDYNLYSGNQHGFQQTQTSLNGRSDFAKTLSSFPYAKDQAWVALYEYSNKRNKTLKLYQLAPKNKAYPLINSITNDVGINPEIYLTTDNDIRVRSQTIRNNYYYEFAPASLDKQQLKQNPYLARDVGELSISGGLRQTSWNTKQKVGAISTESDDLIARTDYGIDDSLMYEVRASGRIYNTTLGLSYLENAATEDMSSIERAASRKVFGSLGFGKLLKGASILRLEFAHEKVNGVASHREFPSNSLFQPHEFFTKLESYSILITKEQGAYWGFNYASIELPMVLGFYTKNKQPFTVFDTDTKPTSYQFVYGYDSGQYSGRYMFNDRRFYADGRFDFGLYRVNAGDAAKQQAKQHFGISSFDSSISLALSGFAEFGYLWQKRSVKYAGTGIRAQFGLNAQVDWYFDTSPEEQSDLSDNKISTGMELLNTRYGPFARLSVIF